MWVGGQWGPCPAPVRLGADAPPSPATHPATSGGDPLAGLTALGHQNAAWLWAGGAAGGWVGVSLDPCMGCTWVCALPPRCGPPPTTPTRLWGSPSTERHGVQAPHLGASSCDPELQPTRAPRPQPFAAALLSNRLLRCWGVFAQGACRMAGAPEIEGPWCAHELPGPAPCAAAPRRQAWMRVRRGCGGSGGRPHHCTVTDVCRRASALPTMQRASQALRLL